jgi:hypothetical protein
MERWALQDSNLGPRQKKLVQTSTHESPNTAGDSRATRIHGGQALDQNAAIESFNCKLRDERLNANLFETLGEAPLPEENKLPTPFRT